MFFIPEYILILFFTIIIDYYAGILLENTYDKRKKKLYLALSLIANIGILAVFKYFNFINDNVHDIADLIGWNYGVENLKIILPIGLSFHTFQAMSYTIEVYRGNEKAERHFGIYALYVMFYPQLVAGPIERPQNLLYQFRQVHTFEYQRVVDGLKLMMWGLFKKVVIADRLALLVDQVYNNPSDYYGTQVIFATILFAFQIYCDFSGYSDMAIGSAHLMGFKLMTNFNRPYFAKSIAEFWKRWHISLSTWFKDYLYIPLGGNRFGKFKWFRNLFITFMVSGLWHGASWNFIVWGALHGVYLIFAIVTQPLRNQINKTLGLNHHSFFFQFFQSFQVFVLVTFAWIFFRAKTFNDSVTLVNNMLDFKSKSMAMVGNYYQQILAISVIGLLLLCEWRLRNTNVIKLLSSFSLTVRWIIYLVMILIIINLGVFGGNNFIYFQF